MRAIQNERGSLLVYAIFLILLISVLTVPLLQISSTRDLTDHRDKNQKIATNLAVSTAEEYLAFLKRCDKCTNLEYFKGFLSGIGTLSTTPIISKVTLPDGTPVTYSMYYQDTGDSKYNINIKVIAGDTDGNNVADEKFAYTKEIIYKINNNINQVINPSDPQPVELGTNNIYLDQTNNPTNPLEGTATQVSELSTAITTYLKEKTDAIEQKITNAKADPSALTCSSCNLNKISTLIANSTNNPVIIKASDLRIDQNVTLGSPTHQVILIVDSVTTTRDNKQSPERTLNLYGDLIVGNYSSADTVHLENANMYLTGTPNFNYLTMSGDFYATSLMIESANNVTLSAKNITIKGDLILKNNADITATEQILVGSIDVQNNTQLNCTASDLFVQGDFTAQNNLSLTVGGSAAVGGTATFQGDPTITSGGGTTILNPGVDDGSGTSNPGEINWNPIRQ